VLAVPELPTGDARRRLLLRYGDLVAALGGTYRTAGDMNISPADLDVVAERCPWVYGTTGKGGNSARGTAIGTLHAIHATVEHAFGSPDLDGVRVLVQGAGAVGADLVRLLRAGGADVLVSDVDDARAAATGATVVAAGDVIGTECDLYSPCAVGGTLNAETIPQLRCRAVAGCANNQLATPEDGERLHEAGILYAPDYVVNAGGVIQLVGLEDLGWTEDEILELFDGAASIRATLERDHIETADDALMDIYRKLRPGEPPTPDSARTLLDNLFFNWKRYDLAKVGRYKVDKKLGPTDPNTMQVLNRIYEELAQNDKPGKEPQEQERHIEHRQRRPAEGEHPRDLIGPAVLVQRGDDTGGHPDHDRHDHRGRGELHRGREVLRQVAAHRTVVHDRDAEVAVDQVAEIEQVLNVARPVEPHLVAHLFDQIRRRVLAEVGHHGVRRDHVGDHERDQRDPEDNEDRQAGPARDVAEEVHRSPSRGGGRWRPCPRPDPAGLSAWSATGSR